MRADLPRSVNLSWASPSRGCRRRVADGDSARCELCCLRLVMQGEVVAQASSTETET